jgi:hypothetical protein
MIRTAVNIFRGGGATVLLDAGKNLLNLKPVKAAETAVTNVGKKTGEETQAVAKTVAKTVTDNGKKDVQVATKTVTKTAANVGKQANNIGNAVKHIFKNPFHFGRKRR